MQDQTVVCDIGSGAVRTGFAGEDAPRSVLTCRKGAVDRGIVSNWDDTEKIWSKALSDELRVQPFGCSVLMTDTPLNPKANREKMTQIAFEQFQVASLYVAIQAVLGLYASARTTGLVIDAGDGVSHTVPVYQGYALPHAINKLSLGGCDITKKLQQMLLDRGKDLEFGTVNSIKEKVGDVRNDDTGPVIERSYALPDGQVINIGPERFECSDQLFNPEPAQGKGLDQAAQDTVQRIDVDIRKDLYANVVLVGGSTMFSGFSKRIEAELTAATPDMPVKIVAPPERKYSVWIGGSILASLSSFQQMWITKAEYEEYGPSMVHRKCF